MRSVMMLGLLAFVPPLAAEEEKRPRTPGEQYKELAKKYEADFQAFVEADRAAKTDEENQAFLSMPGRSPWMYARGFLDLAQRYPRTPAAEDALIWVGEHVLYRPEAHQALKHLAGDYARSEKLGRVFRRQAKSNAGSLAAEGLLREAIARSPHRDVRGLAHYWLARFLVEHAWYVRAVQQPEDHPDIKGVVDRTWGDGTSDRLKGRDADKLIEEAESHYERVVAEYSDVENNDLYPGQPATLGKAARIRLNEIRNLVVGKTAPEIEGTDIDGRTFKLSDYRGKVVVLDFGSYFY